MNREHDLHLEPIAYIINGFEEKFGIPRQSGLTNARSEIHFLPRYRDLNAVRGIEGFSHLWLIWCFSENMEHSEDGLRNRPFRPTVRPPRLGGNTYMGVFATRSPFRPNRLALSSVRLVEVVTEGEEAPILIVEGADLMNQTPIYDIKPYIPFADSHPEAVGGFTEEYSGGNYRLNVTWGQESYENFHALYRKTAPASWSEQDISMRFESLVSEITSVLAEDPRPAYQDDPDRIYGMKYAGFNIRFRVRDREATILDVCP